MMIAYYLQTKTETDELQLTAFNNMEFLASKKDYIGTPT